MIPSYAAVSEPMPPSGGKIEGASALSAPLSLASLLVRETVQNAWDARDDGRGERPVLFSVDGWDLDDAQVEHLRELLPVHDLEGFTRLSPEDEGAEVVHPRAFLDASTARMLVVSDRNTVGLCGPTKSGVHWIPIRNGEELSRGQQRFANFVRNSGRATADTGYGDGGAFGIGKSALWMASQCGTILIHSRTTDERGDAVERFIGVVHGEHFYADGNEYTGRHFIGDHQNDDVVEPLTGAAAAAAVKPLPVPRYTDGDRPVDGTTIFIVAPRFNFDWATEMKLIRDAVRWQVWPKLVPGARGTSSADMHITLGWNNNPVQMDPPLEDTELRPYARTLLDCVRQRRSGEDALDVEALCRSPRKKLGDLKFREGGVADDNVFHRSLRASELENDGTESAPVDLPFEFETPWGQIALIRREPLLLVRYEPIGGSDELSNMVGVFLSADDPEVEAALTSAEPPAHDDWIHQRVPKAHPRDHRRTFANLTMREVRRARKALRDRFRQVEARRGGDSEANVSRRVSGHIGSGIGGRPKPRDPTSSSGISRTPRAALELVESVPRGTGMEHRLEVLLEGVGSEAAALRLTPSARGRDSVGTLSVDHRVDFRWVVDGRTREENILDVDALDGDRMTLYVTIDGDARVRPSVRVEFDEHVD